MAHLPLTFSSPYTPSFDKAMTSSNVIPGRIGMSNKGNTGVNMLDGCIGHPAYLLRQKPCDPRMGPCSWDPYKLAIYTLYIPLRVPRVS